MKTMLFSIKRGRRTTMPAGVVWLALLLISVALLRCTQWSPEMIQVPSPPQGAPPTKPPAAVLGPAPVTATTYLHAPFADGRCGSCHDLQNPQHPETLWASSVLETCRECHWQEIDVAPAYPHEPFTEGDCLSCHDPHAAGQVYLLTTAQNQLCQECHEEPMEQPHPSTAAEECVLCHAGHGSNQPAILREPEQQLCARCHTEVLRQEVVFEPHTRKAPTCSGCHDPHTGSVPPPTASEVCQECHMEVFEAEPAVSHRPVEIGRCLLCHDFHQKTQYALLRASQVEVCSDCHEMEMAVEQMHPTSAAGECALCHLSHGSDHEKLLRKAEDQLCATCHAVSTHGNTDFELRTQAPFELGCSECHNSHGNEGNRTLIRRTIQGNTVVFTSRLGEDSLDEKDDDNRDDLCATCHTTTSHNRVPSNRTENDHYEGKLCTNCHPHDWDERPETVDGFMPQE